MRHGAGCVQRPAGTPGAGAGGKQAVLALRGRGAGPLGGNPDRPHFFGPEGAGSPGRYWGLHRRGLRLAASVLLSILFDCESILNIKTPIKDMNIVITSIETVISIPVIPFSLFIFIAFLFLKN